MAYQASWTGKRQKRGQNPFAGSRVVQRRQGIGPCSTRACAGDNQAKHDAFNCTFGQPGNPPLDRRPASRDGAWGPSSVRIILWFNFVERYFQLRVILSDPLERWNLVDRPLIRDCARLPVQANQIFVVTKESAELILAELR